MCTVLLEVPVSKTDAVRVLAVRDEDPARAWDPPGEWWSDRPGVLGVRDRRAGGAWLAVAPQKGRLSVVLNRADVYSAGLPAGANGLASRGALVLDAVEAIALPEPPQTAGFNLVTIAGGAAFVTSWDGKLLDRAELRPGVHMIAHHDVDDIRSARIARWLPEFKKLAGLGQDWRERWIDLLAQTAQLPAGDDRAIIRDNRGHGYQTLSLLVCTAEVRSADGAEGLGGSVSLESATLAEPAVWDSPEFRLA